MAKAINLYTETLASTPPVLIDVRTVVEITANGYLTGSINLPINALLDDLSKLPANKATLIVTLCQSGHYGSIAMMVLHLLGYTNVSNLGGGMNGWFAAKYSVQK